MLDMVYVFCLTSKQELPPFLFGTVFSRSFSFPNISRLLLSFTPLSCLEISQHQVSNTCSTKRAVENGF